MSLIRTAVRWRHGTGVLFCLLVITYLLLVALYEVRLMSSNKIFAFLFASLRLCVRLKKFAKSSFLRTDLADFILYRSFIYPLLIMATVPMGMTGALLSLVIVNAIPGIVVPLDMITGLGFVILTGVVVNNAILLVDRALQLQKEGMEYDVSLYSAVGDRLRPIFMSAGTSVLGMLPLAVIPGKGAELYQGLGIALTGGLALSTFLTPTVIPALMGLLQDFQPNRSKHEQESQQEESRKLAMDKS